MRFKRLCLNNVGVFRGEHELVLDSEDACRPITLIGGMNGCGKTTLLESILLAFYGKLSPAVKESNHSYDDYLRNLITRGTDGGSSIEILFRYCDNRGDRLYHVTRGWAIKGKSVRERVDVTVDGCYDKLLSKHWSEAADQFLPSRLAGLFFFDGERIESLADPSKSPALISSAINSLLGVDLVEQLEADLDILERRRSKSIQPPEEQARIAQLEDEILALEKERNRVVQELAACSDPLRRAQNALDISEETLRERGGDVAKSRDSYSKRLAVTEAELASIQQQMQVLAAGPLPLVMVRSDLEKLFDIGTASIDRSDNLRIGHVVQERDKKLLARLDESGLSKTGLQTVRKVLAELTASLDDSEQLAGIGQDLTRDALHRIQQLLTTEIDDAVAQAKSLLAKHDELLETQVECQRLLAAAPDEDSIKPLVESVRSCLKEVSQFETKQKKLQNRSEELDRALEASRISRDKFMRDHRILGAEHADAARFVEHASRAREKLKVFREALVQKHIGRLEGLILEGYRSLLRKDSLVAAIKIDPKTAQLELCSASGHVIAADRISAGERQLLATAILWGLARASGRPLPVIIDTPLGRLDSDHRQNFVNSYLPFASHQTFILSTDEEIDEGHYKALKPYLAHEFVLEHDDRLESTEIKSGYFSAETSHAN